MASAAKDYAGKVYDDPAKAYRDAKDGANALYSKFDEARQEAAAAGKSAEFWGEAVGRIASEVAMAIVPIGALAKAGKAKALAKMADAASDLDKVADATKAAAKAKDAIVDPAMKVADSACDVLPCGKPKSNLPMVPKHTIPERQAANELLKKSDKFPADMAKVGVTPDDIAAMVAKEKPLGFKSPEQFDQFKKELAEVMDKTGLGDTEVGLKGTATTFYSENPGKPFGHHWDADPLNPGDFDFDVAGEQLLKKMQDAGIQPSEKYNVFRARDMDAQFPELAQFREKWSKELGREVNFVGKTTETVVRDPTEFAIKGKK
jgi:hypothetical protein